MKQSKHTYKKPIGQITIKKIGTLYSVCISGTPIKLIESIIKAEEYANKLRSKYGRRKKK